jgi:hypothetical protein
MEAQLSPIAARLLGSRGQALLRKSTAALQHIWANNRNAAIALSAVGVGAAVYVSNNWNKEQPRQVVRIFERFALLSPLSFPQLLIPCLHAPPCTFMQCFLCFSCLFVYLIFQIDASSRRRALVCLLRSFPILPIQTSSQCPQKY